MAWLALARAFLIDLGWMIMLGAMALSIVYAMDEFSGVTDEN